MKRKSTGVINESTKKAAINLFYIPAIVLFLVFVIYPFLHGIRISFTNWNGYSQTMKFVGIDNYVRLFQDANVRTALVNTLVYGIASTIIQNVLGLAYALFLNTKFKGRSIVRTVIYMPVMIAPLIMGYIMYFLFQYDGGALNDIIMLLGHEPVDLLANSSAAIAIIVMVNSLQFVGVSMVIYLAGLQNVPNMYYEAAMLDGASSWQRFKHITFPLLMPAISSSTILNLIGGLKLFRSGYGAYKWRTRIYYTFLIYIGNESVFLCPVSRVCFGNWYFCIPVNHGC